MIDGTPDGRAASGPQPAASEARAQPRAEAGAEASPPAAWLRTLGRLELVAGTPEAPGARVMGPSKPLALLAYLALAPRRRATRDRLVALLWSDAEPERARSTLRQTVWALRQRLGEDALVADGDEVVLAHPLEVDAMRFERAAAAGVLAEAWALYAGPFIPDFALLGGAGFEHWVDGRRALLDAAWRSVGERLAQEALDAARPREAIPVLRALVAAAAPPQEAWRMLLEALVADGDRAQAVLEAERLERQLAEAGERPGAALRALLERVRRPVPATAPAEGPRRPEMVGREATFAALLAGWRRATAGTGAVLVMRAGAGLGKTRMLAEVQQRLEDMGGAVLPLRARRADRDIPYALAAALATGLADRPGAAGVSMATAAVLVELAPGLSNTFPRATPAPVPPDDALRVRTLALVELLQAVTEEAPLAILVDDLHWSDDASRQLLASLCERIPGLPLLLALAMRPLHGDWPVPASASAVELLPLSAEQVELLVASLAQGAPALLAELGRTLHAVSGGIPLLVVAALDLAQERGWLRIEGEEWRGEAPERVRQALAGGSVLDQLLRDLPADALAMLVALALVRRPLPAAVLRRVAGTGEAGRVLETLEQRGLVIAAGQGWEVAHDRLADAALTVTPLPERHVVTDRLVQALLAEPSPPARTWQLAGRLLMTVKPVDALRCFRSWMELTQKPAGWRDPLGAAVTFLGPEARLADAQQLARGIPRWLRLRLGYPVATFAMVPVLLMALASGLTVLGQRWLAPRAVRIDLVEPTSSRGFLWDPRFPLDADSMPRAPLPLRVTFQDAAGRPTVNAPTTAVVRLVERTGNVRLEGRTRAPVRAGQAEFPNLTVAGSGGFRLDVAGDGVPAARSQRMYATVEGRLPDVQVRILEGTVNGQAVDSLHREVRVQPGDTIAGTLTFRTLTDARGAAILLGGVALWGDRTRQAVALRSLPPHGEVTVRETLDDKISGYRWVAPRRPGRYAIMFVYEAETEMRFIASSTNWVLGAPRWNDGNDLADLSAPQLRQLEQFGWILRNATQLRVPIVRNAAGQPATIESPRRLVGTILWINVVAD